METTTLTISDPNLLAEFVREDQFKAFFEKRFQVPPDHMGLLMRNGQFVEAYKGAHFSVGGLAHQLAGLIGGSQAVSLLLADLKTFQSWYNFTVTSKDKVEVNGTVTIDAQINPEKPQNIIGMMAARKSLSKQDVVDRLKPHLWDRVFEAAVGRVNSNEIRGNKGLQDMIQGDIMKEVERIAGDLGVLVRNVSVSWALNDVEVKEMTRAKALRDIEQAEFDFNRLKNDMEREQQTTELKIVSKSDVDKLNLKTEADINKLVLSQEIEFVDARETGKRVAEMKAMDHELNVLRTERLAKFENEIAQATHDGVDLKVIDERRRVLERQTDELDAQHRLRLRAIERDFDRETRNLQRQEDVTNRRDDRSEEVSNRKEDREERIGNEAQDRSIQVKNRKEDRAEDDANRLKDRDYDFDTRETEIGVRKKERDFDFGGRREEVDVTDKEEYARMAREREENKNVRENIKGMQDLEIDIERDRLDRRIKEDDAFHRRDMDTARLDAQREVDRMQLGAKMTPEQILAINAGLSPDVANILVEQAKAQGANNTQTMQIMRELVDQANRHKVESEAQARAMFQMGMDGTVGVAAGAGPGGMPKPKVGPVRGGDGDGGGGGGGGGGNAGGNRGGANARGGDNPPAGDDANNANNANNENRAGMGGGPAAGVIHCQACGKENTANAKFCVACGQKIRH